MRKVEKKDYSALIALLLFVSTIAMGYFFISPYVIQLKELNIEIGAKQQENEKLRTNLAALLELKNDFKTNQETVDILEIAMPADDDMSNAINTLDSIALQDGVVIQNIKKTKSEISDYLQLDLTFESSYEALKLFIDSIENDVRFINPANITIKKKTTEQGSDYVLVSMTINMYKSVVKQEDVVANIKTGE